MRALLRSAPIYLFLTNTFSLLQAMRCQTSPDYTYLKYGRIEIQRELDFSGDGGMLYYLSSKILFWQTDPQACLAVDMIPSPTQGWSERGSLSLLWPLIKPLCLGQFIET